jgi:hypothetical protein
VGQEAHLIQWLSKRLGRQLIAPDLTAGGFQLMGGRLLPADHRCGHAGRLLPHAAPAASLDSPQREATPLVLLDDEFTSIVIAVRLGRILRQSAQGPGYILAVLAPIAGLALFPCFS